MRKRSQQMRRVSSISSCCVHVESVHKNTSSNFWLPAASVRHVVASDELALSATQTQFSGVCSPNLCDSRVPKTFILSNSILRFKASNEKVTVSILGGGQAGMICSICCRGLCLLRLGEGVEGMEAYNSQGGRRQGSLV